MGPIEERAPLSFKKADKIRSDLHLSRQFVCQCLGLKGGSAWTTWEKEQEIPVKYQQDLSNLLVALQHLHKGGRVLEIDEKGEARSPEIQIIRDAVGVLAMLQNGRLGDDNRIVQQSGVRQKLLEETKSLLESLLVS